MQNIQPKHVDHSFYRYTTLGLVFCFVNILFGRCRERGIEGMFHFRDCCGAGECFTNEWSKLNLCKMSWVKHPSVSFIVDFILCFYSTWCIDTSHGFILTLYVLYIYINIYIYMCVCKQHFWSILAKGGGGGGGGRSRGCSHRLRDLSKRVIFLAEYAVKLHMRVDTFLNGLNHKNDCSWPSCICVCVCGGGGGGNCMSDVKVWLLCFFQDCFSWYFPGVCLSEIMSTWTLWQFDWDENKIAGLMVCFAGLPFVWFFLGGEVEVM